MSLTRLGYNELGLKITEPLKDDPHRTRQPHMLEENKDEGVGDPIKLLLEEALVQQRDELWIIFPNYSMTVDNSRHIYIQRPLWRSGPIQGTS